MVKVGTGFQSALNQLKLDKGVVVYFGKDNFNLNQQIEVKSAASLLKDFFED